MWLLINVMVQLRGVTSSEQTMDSRLENILGSTNGLEN